MLTPNVLALLPGRRPLRQYRRILHQTLQSDPAVRLLPALLDIPLECAPLPDPEAILAAPASFALLGPPAGGRTLALFQIAAHWAGGACRAPLVCLPLGELDSPNLSPRAIVTGALHRSGARTTIVDSREPALLLVDEWEQVPANRRLLWRQYLTGLAVSWPAARAVVALPPAETWPELQPLQIAPPNAAALAVWFGRLLPNHDPAPILAALEYTPMAMLRQSLADLLLLALVYPIAGLPASRAALYEQAFALAQPVLRDPPLPSLDDEVLPIEELSAPLAIGRAVLRHYRLARGLAGGADLATLADLSPVERAAVAPLAAGLFDDPTPVFDLLWAVADRPDYPALLACARERPTAAPAQTLRLLTMLAEPEAPESFTSLAPVLPQLLISIAHHDLPEALALVPVIAHQIPAYAPWLALIDDPAAPITLRWAAVDQLAVAPPPVAVLSTVPPAADRVSLAGRALLCVHTSPLPTDLLLQPPLNDGLAELLNLAADSRRRYAVASRLLADPATAPVLRRQALAAVPMNVADAALVEQALIDADADVRETARVRLLNRAPADSLAALERILAQPNLPLHVAVELLSLTTQLDDPGVVKALARCAVTGHQRMPVRLFALDQLAVLGASGSAALLSLLSVAALPTPVRATLVRHLGARGQAALLHYLRKLLHPAVPPLVRRAAVAALADLVRRPATHDAALAGLLTILQRPQLDREVTIAAMRGLAVASPTIALPAVAARLDRRYAAALAQAWHHTVPQLAATPAADWPALPLDAATATILADALAVGATPADPPSSVGELAASQAYAEALVAVEVLATFARREPALLPDVQSRLRRALTVLEQPGITEAILYALAGLTHDAGVSELARLLDDPAMAPNLRWRAIDTLGHGPGVAVMVLQRLQRSADDPFTRSKLVALVGVHAPPGALSLLRQIAEDAANPEHLRRAALSSLGNLDDPAAVTALVRIAADDSSTSVRASAAAALPAGLAASTCRALRDLLRNEREPSVLAAILSALGRAGDREALPLLLRYSQSEHASVALAAIESVAAIGDTDLAAPLVRVSQNTLVAAHVRLAAVCGLVQLCGDEFVSLLRDYLTSSHLPLRLRAHAALAVHHADDPRLITPIADPDAPLALRLEALQRLAARVPNENVIRLVLNNPDEALQLRLAAAAALARADDPAVVATLNATLSMPTLPLLQRRCLDTLATLAHGDAAPALAAQVALETIALSADILPAMRHWASVCLNNAPRRR
jgi:HEAT repeat protein